jgi:hypothetical protein
MARGDVLGDWTLHTIDFCEVKKFEEKKKPTPTNTNQQSPHLSS